MSLTEQARVADLESALNHVDAAIRRQALLALVDLAERGQLPLAPEREVANMHCHTFFSYNAFGHSPTSLAWLARKQGIKLLGMVDFDVLDGVDEFLAACDEVGVRASAGMETRVYLPEFASRVINSPGEPGVYYHMGIGFTTSAVPPEAGEVLADLKQRAEARNRRLVDRVNAHLSPVTLDYDRDVRPLTPAGNPTERHIVLAYFRAVERQRADPVRFWAGRLRVRPEALDGLWADRPAFLNLIRARLMKQGGLAYQAPGPDTFPSLDSFHHLVLACGALPCATWLDGTSPGEQAIEELLDLLIARGVVALNIIPDRNWNIEDPELRAQKLGHLYRLVQLAQDRALTLNVGTEMNASGQKLVDDFSAPELAPVREAFLDGAYFIYGHTALQRALGWGYQSEWSRTALPARTLRNPFYTRVGRLLPPGEAGQVLLRQGAPYGSPEHLLAYLTRGPAQ